MQIYTANIAIYIYPPQYIFYIFIENIFKFLFFKHAKQKETFSSCKKLLEEKHKKSAANSAGREGALCYVYIRKEDVTQTFRVTSSKVYGKKHHSLTSAYNRCLP